MEINLACKREGRRCYIILAWLQGFISEPYVPLDIFRALYEHFLF